MTEEDLIEKLAVYLATERSKVGVYPASQIARQVISMVRERDRQKRALDELIAGDADLYGLSAAPSPDGDEVERVADAIIAAQAGPAKKLSDITNPYGRDYELRKARAAISAMRPAPKPGEKVIQGLEEAVRYLDKGEQRIMQDALVRSVKVIARPAPKLTEEDRARVERALLDAQSLILDRFAYWESDARPAFRDPTMQSIYTAVRAALSLIDKLTEAG